MKGDEPPKTLYDPENHTSFENLAYYVTHTPILWLYAVGILVILMAAIYIVATHKIKD